MLCKQPVHGTVSVALAAASADSDRRHCSVARSIGHRRGTPRAMLRSLLRSGLLCSANLWQQQLLPAAWAAKRLGETWMSSASSSIPRGFAARQRGFAAGSGSDGGSSGSDGGSSGRGPDQQKAEPQHQEQQGDRVQQQQPQQQSMPASAEESQGAAGEGPKSASGGSSAQAGKLGEQQQQQQQLLPPFGVSNDSPELQKYIDSLKELKGSSKVQRHELGSEPTWWDQLVWPTLGAFLQNQLTAAIKSRIEMDFDADEFIEGAKDAFWIVHKLMGEEDWPTLKPMVSAKLYDALYDTAKLYRENGLMWRTQVEDEGSLWGISGMAFLSKGQLAAYDPEQAALGAEDVNALSPSGAWLVLNVHFKPKQAITISRQEDGQVVSELVDRRRQVWKFATGPLPANLPVKQLDTQWFLLSI